MKPWPHLAPIELGTASDATPSASGPRLSRAPGSGSGSGLGWCGTPFLRCCVWKAVLARPPDVRGVLGTARPLPALPARLQEVHASLPRRRSSSTSRSSLCHHHHHYTTTTTTSINLRQISAAVAARPRFASCPRTGLNSPGLAIAVSISLRSSWATRCGLG